MSKKQRVAVDTVSGEPCWIEQSEANEALAKGLAVCVDDAFRRAVLGSIPTRVPGITANEFTPTTRIAFFAPDTTNAKPGKRSSSYLGRYLQKNLAQRKHWAIVCVQHITEHEKFSMSAPEGA